MADENNSEGISERAGEGEAPLAEIDVKPAKSSFKKILILLIPILLIGGTGAGLYFSGLLNHFLGKEDKKKEEEEKKELDIKEIKYLDIPELLVNLNSRASNPNFLKLALTIELSSEKDANEVKMLQPRLIDQYMVYLRQLRIEDLRGSAGIQRLREELLTRTNAIIAPIKANNILFKTMIVQ